MKNSIGVSFAFAFKHVGTQKLEKIATGSWDARAFPLAHRRRLDSAKIGDDGCPAQPLNDFRVEMLIRIHVDDFRCA